MVTSGIRIGTPAMTTRGCKEREAREIVHLIDDAIKFRDDDSELDNIKKEVLNLCKQFPVYS